VRIIQRAPPRIGDADIGERRDRALMRLAPGDALVRADGLGDLLADREHRIECARRLLEDHADAAATQPAQRARRRRSRSAPSNRMRP